MSSETPELKITTFLLHWPDGRSATVRVMREGARAVVLETDGARERVQKVLLHHTWIRIDAEVRSIARAQQCRLEVQEGASPQGG